MLHYPACLRADEAGITVTFRDIPEAITAGATLEEAIEMAADALALAMHFYLEDSRSVPLPSKARSLKSRKPSRWRAFIFTTVSKLYRDDPF
jgi:antitoxin HicB